MKRTKTALSLRTAALLLALLMLMQVLTACQIGNIIDQVTSESTTSAETLFETTSPDGETTGGETTADTTASDATTSDGSSSYEPLTYKIGHPELVYTYTAEKEAALASAIASLKETTVNGTIAESEYVALYESVEAMVYELQKEYQIAQVETYLYMDDEAIDERFLHISEFYNEEIQKFVALYRTIEESKYKEVFYAEWSEEDIAEALALADNYDEATADLKSKINELELEQRGLSADKYDEESVRIYREILKLNTQLAQNLQYDGYMEYAYDAVYTRDYSPADAAVIEAYAKEKLAPMISTMLSRLNRISLTNDDINKLRKILYGTFEESANMALLKEFYASLGGDINKAFLDYLENGYYYIGYDSTKSEAGAFTFYIEELGVPVMYFGPGYQTVFTFVHEFGHYYSNIKSTEESLSFDLAETQSQGDEWLFLAFLKDKMSTNVSNYLIYYNALNSLLTIMIAMTVNHFEILCYENGAAGADTIDFDQLYKDSCEAVYSYDQMKNLTGSNPEDYWRKVVIENPGYYISYAISLIPSIELYAMAVKDYASAVAIYEAIQGNKASFCDTLVEAGLYSPFDEEAYSLIVQAFKR